MMVALRLAFLIIVPASFLSAASVEERLHRLESRVSEMQILLEQLSKKSPPPPSLSPSSPGRSHQIRRGDSYWSIARRHGISVAMLQSANPGVHPQRLSIGKSITIPGTPGTSSFPRTHTGNGTYQVRKGDVLGRIAKRHHISLNQLMRANPGINPRRLRIGKILNIPGKAPSAPQAPVETKSGILERSGPSAPDLSPPSRNPYLRALEEDVPPTVRKASEDPPQLDLSKPRLITLDEDTRFAEIAGQHRTTVAQLNQLNKRELSPQQMIKAGSQLYIPAR